MVQEYSLKFTQLARYGPYVFVDGKDRMSKFVSGLNNSMVNECRSSMLNSDITLARLMTHAQQIEEQNIRMRERQSKRARTGSFSFAQPKSQGGNRSQHSQKFSVPALSSSSVLAPKSKNDRHDGAPGFVAQGSENRGLTYPFYEECGKNHLGACMAGSDVCFGCSKPGHRI